MLTKRGMVRTIGAATFLLLCGFGLVCCTQSNTSSVDTDGPRLEGPAEEATAPHNESAPPPESKPGDDPPPPINMTESPEPEPKTPRYLAIMEEFQSDTDSQVRATTYAPSKLVVETKNIKRLRITREGLPLAQNRSIVLRIDGQGIEWTRKYLAVELEKSAAGEWSVVRRKPVKP